MRQHKVVITLKQHELMLQAIFALAQRGDPTAHGRHTLANVQVEPFHTRRIDLLATRHKDLLHPLHCPKDYPMLHAHEARWYDFTT